MAIGIIAMIIGFNTHINFSNQSKSLVSSIDQPESKVLNLGELPVAFTRISDIPIISNQNCSGNQASSVMPSLQNTLFMAPQIGDAWTKKENMPTPRSGLCAEAIGNKIYCIGGQKGQFGPFKGECISTVEEYDTITNRWTKKIRYAVCTSFTWNSRVKRNHICNWRLSK